MTRERDVRDNRDRNEEEEEMPDTYKIQRYYFNQDFATETVATGLTLEEAQEHCNDPETSSETATLAEGVNRTQRRGPWFDGYTAE